jgi:hypothetical protein
LEEVVVCAGHKVLMEVENDVFHIVDNPHGILAQQLRPHPIHLLDIYVIIILNYVN